VIGKVIEVHDRKAASLQTEAASVGLPYLKGERQEVAAQNMGSTMVCMCNCICTEEGSLRGRPASLRYFSFRIGGVPVMLPLCTSDHKSCATPLANCVGISS